MAGPSKNGKGGGKGLSGICCFDLCHLGFPYCIFFACGRRRKGKEGKKKLWSAYAVFGLVTVENACPEGKSQ